MSSSVADSSFITKSFWFRPPSLDATMKTIGVNLFRISTDGAHDTLDDTTLRLSYTVPSVGADAGSNIFLLEAASEEVSSSWKFKDIYSSIGSWSHVFMSLDTTASSQRFSDTVFGAAYLYINLNRLQTNEIGTNAWVTSTTPGNNASISAFEVAIFGKTIGLPSTPARLNYTTSFFGNPQYAQPTMQFADFQMWVGKFVDPTVAGNLEKFVKVTNGIGRPVDPKIAEAAFGKPTFRFTGDKTTFSTNTGNGGAFVKTGTINNFTPAPGQ